MGYASGNKNNKGAILTKQEVIGNLEAMIQELKKFSPDIVALQETDFRAKRTFNINQLDYLAHGLGLPHAAYAVTWNKRYLPWPYGPPRIHFGPIVSGQAVLSRYPLENGDVRYFEKPAENAFWYNLFYLDRVVLKIKVAGRSLVIWNVHLEAFKPNTRMKQARLLAEWVRGQEGTMLVLGDFNSASAINPDLSEKEKQTLEESPAALAFFLQATGLKNAENKNIFYTMPSGRPVKKIDHILYSKNLEMKSVQTMPALEASDHLPVLAEFFLPSGK